MKKYIIILFLTVSSSAFSQDSDTLDVFLNTWHQSAAEANADIFFGSMAEDGIYIGTDATERWDKADFGKFAKAYFDEGKAWDFKPYDRMTTFSEDGSTAWFSELLDTWMGTCRGSGIVSKINGEWKIRQYHLSVTVPNETMKDFIELMKN